MRLLRLEMRGFGPFRNLTELKFDDADFFALVGPTGSGKSTVLDAVCFALYGSVPRYDDAGLIHPVITLGTLEAKVRLDFEIGGDHYIAARTVQRTAKGAKTREARLERFIADDETESLASGGPQVSAAVIRLLGLRFEDFTRCVALPQGEFAQFLRGDVEKRRGLMLRLLNLGVYTRMGAAARQLEAKARNQIELIDRQLRDSVFATEDALQAAESRLTDVNRLSNDVEAAEPVLADLADKEQAARKRAADARAAVESLAAISIPAAVEQMATDRRDAMEALEKAETALTNAVKARKAAEAAREELPPLAPLEKARHAHDELDGCEGEIAAATTALEQEQAEAARRQEALQAANAAAEQAAAALQALERRHLARSLSETLVAGEPCPVCEQIVEHLPGHEPLAELSEARQKAAGAKQEAERRERARRITENALAGINGGLEKLSLRRTSLVAQLADHPDRAALDGVIDRIETAEAKLSTARTEEDTVVERRQAAKKRLDALGEADRQARGIYTAQRERVIALGPPAAEGRDVLDDWKALADWAETRTPEQSSAVDAADNDAALQAGERQKVMTAFHARLQRLEIGLPDRSDLVALVSAVATAAGNAAHEVTRIETAMADARKLEEERAGLDEERTVAKLLGKLLEADEFPQWLVQEAMAVLTVDASEILRELTGGQFSLAFGENEFVVVDHANADERRPARTLSGGETFQASLALALALSQQLRTIAAEGAPRLDAIFLDEGFGSLDPETLDVVAATIENLGQSGRMVGIVTHVSELATRVPVRFQVSKGLGSSMVEKRYA